MEYNKEFAGQGKFLLPVLFVLIVITFIFSILTFQDLSRISMPVALNEPLTFLQKLVEYIEYAGLLHAAAAASDPLDRLAVCNFFII